MCCSHISLLALIVHDADVRWIFYNATYSILCSYMSHWTRLSGQHQMILFSTGTERVAGLACVLSGFPLRKPATRYSKFSYASLINTNLKLSGGHFKGAVIRIGLRSKRLRLYHRITVRPVLPYFFCQSVKFYGRRKVTVDRDYWEVLTHTGIFYGIYGSVIDWLIDWLKSWHSVDYRVKGLFVSLD